MDEEERKMERMKAGEGAGEERLRGNKTGVSQTGTPRSAVRSKGRVGAHYTPQKHGVLC